MDDKPEEVSGRFGMTQKTEYMKDMENLEKVENQFFTRMTMSAAQKKYHKKMLEEGNKDNLDNFDELKDIESMLDSRNGEGGGKKGGKGKKNKGFRK